MKNRDSSSPAETVANIEELLTDILLRVPAGTLIHFKRVSKQWLSLISSSSFRNSHAKCVHNKTLYICTYEHRDDLFNRYLVQAIKVSDLFSFSDTATPITIYPPKSKSKSKRKVLREVALLKDYPSGLVPRGRVVPRGMGFGVFGSRIVLAGGSTFNTPKPSYVLDTTDSEAKFVSSVIPDMEQDMSMYPPLLHEIDGKLYALSKDNFAVFDPKTKVWAPLPPLITNWTSSFSCSVILGSKIVATLKDGMYGSNTFCFDVASPHGSWTLIEPPLRYHGTRNYNKHALVLDSEDDFEKLMFTYLGTILVYRILLSNAGEPNKIELVASIHLPKFPGLSDEFVVVSYCCALVGDREVCFTFLYSKEPAAPNIIHVVVLNLEFACSKSGASNPPESSSSRSSSHPSFLSYTTYCGSFYAKAWVITCSNTTIPRNLLLSPITILVLVVALCFNFITW